MVISALSDLEGAPLKFLMRCNLKCSRTKKHHRVNSNLNR